MAWEVTLVLETDVDEVSSSRGKFTLRRTCWLLTLVLLVNLPSFGQTDTPQVSPPEVAAHSDAVPKQDAVAKSPDEMKAILAEVFTHNTFAYLPGPYHFLATFETFSADGEARGNGSIEKFFSAPGRLKVTTRFRDHTMTAWYVDGKWRYSDDGFDGSIMTYFVNDFLLNPLPPPTGTAHRDMETKVMQLRGKPLDCGMFQFFLGPIGLPPLPKEVLCVTRDSSDLALRQTQYFSIQYQQFEPILGRSIPRYIVASQGSVVRCRIRVQQVDQQGLDDVALTPPPDASLASPGANWLSLTTKENTPLHRVTPVWPPGVKDIAGPVALHVLISRTGTIKDIELVYTPSP
jgi:hypothetical protein